MPIHRDAPTFEELSPSTELLETGIKVIDLVCPFAKGGKVGLFGGAGVGKTVRHAGAHPQHRRRSTPASRCLPAWASARREGNDFYHEMKDSQRPRQSRDGVRADE